MSEKERINRQGSGSLFTFLGRALAVYVVAVVVQCVPFILYLFGRFLWTGAEFGTVGHVAMGGFLVAVAAVFAGVVLGFTFLPQWIAHGLVIVILATACHRISTRHLDVTMGTVVGTALGLIVALLSLHLLSGETMAPIGSIGEAVTLAKPLGTMLLVTSAIIGGIAARFLGQSTRDLFGVRARR